MYSYKFIFLFNNSVTILNGLTNVILIVNISKINSRSILNLISMYRSYFHNNTTTWWYNARLLSTSVLQHAGVIAYNSKILEIILGPLFRCLGTTREFLEYLKRWKSTFLFHFYQSQIVTVVKHCNSRWIHQANLNKVKNY